MAVDVSIPPPLYPRAVPPTPEQLAERHARSSRRALRLRLCALFTQGETQKDEIFSGKMNLPPDRGESAIGCELAPPFVGYLETGRVPDYSAQRERRQLWLALDRLQVEQPDLHLIVVDHLRGRVTLRHLARRWNTDRGRLGRDFRDALDLLLAFLASHN